MKPVVADHDAPGRMRTNAGLRTKDDRSGRLEDSPPVTDEEREPKADTVDLADLKRKSVRGGAVTLVSQGISIAIQLSSTVVLARLLSPEDYGVMAMVMAVVGFASLFRDLGLSSAAIQKKDLTRAQQSNLFWLNVAAGTALTVIVAAASPLVSWFYHNSELEGVTIALSLSFLIGSVGTQHSAMLVRKMQFGRQAIARLSGSLVTLATAVTLALQGFSYWSLVWGNLAGGLANTALLLVLSPFRPGWITRGSGIREMVNFGASVTAFDFVNYFSRNLDNILIGHFWGAGPLGLYSRAYSLLMLPITSIRTPINAVAFPAMSSLQDKHGAFREYYLKATSLIALLSMPMATYFFVSSRPIIDLILGREWLGVSPIFSWLALAAFIQPASGFAGSMLLSLGQGGRYLSCGIFNAILISTSFLVGVFWGPMGVAIAFSITSYVGLVPWLWWAFRESPVTLRDFFRACATPVTVSFVGFLLSHLVRLCNTPSKPGTELALSAIAFALGACACFAMSRSLRRLIRDLLDILKSSRTQ